MILFKLIGALGLLIISTGIIIKNRKKQDLMFIVGGACLEIYSIYIGDLIFIILQLVFIFSALFDFVKLNKK